MSADFKQVVGSILVYTGNPYAMVAGAALLYTGAREAAKEAQAEARRRAKEQAASRSIKGNLRGGSEAHFVCFGQVRAGGIYCALGPSPFGGGVIYVGLAHSLSHPGGCEGSIRALWVNDYRIAPSSISGDPLTAEAEVTDSRFLASDGTKMITFRTYRGTDTQTADTTLSQSGFAPGGGFAGGGSTAHRRGICWTRFALTRPAADPDGFSKAFPTGIPVLSVELRGNRCYDPRSDSNNGGSGTQRYASPSTWAWSQNPAVIAATYMIMEKSDGGMGYDPSEIDWPSVAAAANICDETVTNLASSPTVSQARFKCNVALDTQDSRETNLQKILDTMMGVRVRVGNKYKIHAGAYSSPTFDFDESYLRGPLRVSTRSPLDQLYNAVRITHDDEDQSYIMVEAPPFTSAAYEAQDGDERMWREEARPGVTNSYQAQYIGTVLGQMSRTQKVIEAPCNLKALNLEVWETGTVVLDELGIDGVYRLVGWEWETDGPKLILREETSDVWDVDFYVAAVSNPTPPINTETPAAPAGVTATAVYDGIAIRWTSPEPPSVVASRVDIYRAGTGSPSVYSKIGSTSGRFYHDPVVDGSTYSYLLKAVNYQGVESAYSAGAQATARTIPEIQSSGSGVATYSQLNTAQNRHEFYNLLADRGIEIGLDEDTGAVFVEALSSEDDHLALSADFASTSISFADVTDFKFQLAENSLYCIKLRGLVQSASTTNGFGIGATAPTGTTMQLQLVAPDSGASTTGFHGFTSGTTSVTQTTTNVPVADTTYPFLATFIVATGAESGSPSTGFVGDFQIRFATENGGTSATLKANSLMVIDKLSNMTPTATLTLGDPGFGASYTSDETTLNPTPAAAQITVTYKTDGTYTVTVGSGDTLTGSPTTGNWGTPTTAGAGSSYEMTFAASGETGDGTTSNDCPDWTPLTIDRRFRFTVSSGAGLKTGSLTLVPTVRKLGTTTPTSTDSLTLTVSADSA